MSSGPIVAALTGVPAGRIIDRIGAYPVTIIGLVAMAAGTSILPLMPTGLGIPGYIAPLVVITAGFALFQAANNTAVMTDIRAEQRGVVSGLLNLSRNLGLITGASVMGSVFALGTASSNLVTASQEAVVAGMRATFAFAAVFVIVALTIALASHAGSRRAIADRRVQGDGLGPQ